MGRHPFPRLNTFSYWVYLFGGIFLNTSFLLGGAPNSTWVAYPPLSTEAASNMAFYAVGLQILGVSSLASAVNFITTILNMRAPGMTFMRLPVFVWMALVANFLVMFRDADHRCGTGHAAVRHRVRCTVLPAVHRRRPDPVAAPVLVVRAS